jgi:DNA-binding NarL/FixJ family response regulator
MSRGPYLPQPRRETVLEFCLAAERIDLDEQRWLEGVAAATLPLLPRSDDHAAVCGAVELETGLWTNSTTCVNSALLLADADRVGNAATTSSQRDRFNGMVGVGSFRGLLHQMPRLRAAVDEHGIYELAYVTTSTPRGFVAVFVHLDEVLPIEPRQRVFWSELAAHLGRTSSLRHGIATSCVADANAVFSPRGSCVHARSDLSPPQLERLRAHVVARERVRARGEEDVACLLECWTSQGAAGWTIVDHFERDGERWIVVWPNLMARHGPRSLDANERRMLALVLEGSTNRAAAAELGLSFASASRTLASAMRKLGLRDLATLSSWRSRELDGELLRLPLGIAGLVAIGVPTAAAHEVDGLTSGERAVLGELVRGRSNREIGSLRGTSERTVANQVQAIFDKLGVGSRRELLHRIGAPGRARG